jgi:hypothetical protein
MKRSAFLLMTVFVTTVGVYGQGRQQSRKDGTWYEEALHSLNPNDIDYGSMWEERKRAILHQIGNPYFQYSFAATAAVVVLFTWVCVQRVSRKRALDLAALSIADILRHDEYSRQVADKAVRRYNEHIESCNRLIEAGRDHESELQRVRKELADTRDENRRLRNDVAEKQKIIAGMTQEEKAEQAPPVQKERESTPGHLIAHVRSLEKKLREAQRKNQQPKGTSVNDHRA